jgi:hypothetical protein
MYVTPIFAFVITRHQSLFSSRASPIFRRIVTHYNGIRVFPTLFFIVIMANFIRSAKSVNDWTLNDLESYHISLTQAAPLQFFGLPVGDDAFAIVLGKLMTFHVTGVATAHG